MRRTYTLAMLWAGLALGAVLMASQASAAPSSDQQPLSERIASAEAKERAHEAAARRGARRQPAAWQRHLPASGRRRTGYVAGRPRLLERTG